MCHPVLMLAAFASPFKKGREWSGWEPRHGRQSRKGSGRALRDAVEIQLRWRDCNQTSNIEDQTFVKIVLAYSGGLDTSVILRWLKDNYDAHIIAFCADIGQEEELAGLEEKALKTGASKCIIEDLQEEFARDFIFPMFQAGALYENQYFLGTSIARPLIAKWERRNRPTGTTPVSGVSMRRFSR